MADIDGQVISAAPRVVGNRTIYDVAFSDGNTYSTFDKAVYAKSVPLAGQQASARTAIKQNGQYTNYYLNDIAPLGQLPPEGVTLPPTPGRVVQVNSAMQKPASTFNGGMTPEREQKIVKQSSFSTAFNFVGHILSGSGDLEEAKVEAHKLAAQLYVLVMGEKPKESVVADEPIAVGATGVAGSSPENTGDAIPWR